MAIFIVENMGYSYKSVIISNAKCLGLLSFRGKFEVDAISRILVGGISKFRQTIACKLLLALNK